MRNKMKFLTLSLVALLMAFSVLSGCSKNSAGGDSKGDDKGGSKDSGSKSSEGFVLGEDELEYTMYGHYDWYTMPNWGEDEATKWIKENKKVNVKPISSGGNAAQKFNTMIVGNELPDVIWLERDADLDRLREADMLVPLDEYIDKYPNIKEWVGESTLNILRAEDGHIYTIPNWYTTQPNGNTGYVVNEKIYKELGSPKLETTDDLYAYLKQVKEKYPDIIPFEAGQGDGIEVLYSAFGEGHPNNFPGMRAVPNGDKLTSIFADPVYKESMLYISKLYRERLIDQDTLTQTSDQVKEKVTTGRFAVYAGSSPTENASFAHTQLKAQDPDAGLKMIWPIHKEGLNKENITPGTWNQLGWNVSVITKAAKNPEAIFAFLDWMVGPEGQRTVFWGPEGLYWEGTQAVEGIAEAPIFTDKYLSDVEGLSKLMNTTDAFQWVGNTVYIDKSKTAFEMTLPEEQQNWETRYQMSITWKTQANSTEFVYLNPLPESEEGIIQQRVNDIFDEARAKAIHAKNDDEVIKILDQAEKDAQAVGYDKLLEFKTKRWQENKERMAGK
ncbi:extracellular solute-binding protein [Bacillus sp. FJAT-49732]|uniref:Extracellular solute-binding protein n=1 Tax=Lederbergia citrisecunda TaxID=2833583 RepID=A0A942TME5_9BACI|nr:extracellular solute-binding protein [Lederbergia citrisecunda]MBS4200245.1 extracellular solute-binding protein [Lederbergia citrisecunda]